VTRPKPLVIERNGVRVAVAVQVQVSPAAGGCGCATADSCDDDASGALDAVSWGVGSFVLGAAAVARLLAAALVIGVGRAGLLGLNVVGLLGAKLARGYLLGWAHLGGTHKQLSRSISPWLPEGKTPLELPALLAEVLEKPEGMQAHKALPPHADVTWTQLAAAQTERRLKP
jgi:hypothetical protein